MARQRILIDTSILIDHLRKQRKDRTIFYRNLPNCDYSISVITDFEFRVGITPKNREFGTKLLAAIDILSFELSCVDTAIRIQQQLRAENQMIPIADLFIAATAITHALPLLTLNQKHFSRITDLTLYPLEK